MPAKSAAQKRLMEAAAHTPGGYGGVPQAIGKEFIGKDGAPIAAGLVLVAPDGDILLLKRSKTEENYPGYWALPGGKAEDGEGALECALRETTEEVGFTVEDEGVRVLDRQPTPNGMVYTTFIKSQPDKITPKLNGEHAGFVWTGLDDLPQPLHPSVAATLKLRAPQRAQDMKPADWDGLVKGFLKWVMEEENEPEHAADSLAMDRASVRTIDKDGRMHVEITNISKAMVCEYWGYEIPNADKLGLDANTKYRLLRDPNELAKSASTFNNIQLLIKHTPVSAKDHKPDEIIGTTGSDAVFEYPYLKNSLAVWTQRGIDAIESGDMKELSAGYRYTPVLESGVFEGAPFDLRMTEIFANHLTIVEAGRCGDDVMVEDSLPEDARWKVIEASILELNA